METKWENPVWKRISLFLDKVEITQNDDIARTNTAVTKSASNF